jgi:CRP/FNR family cyclic AMP-dependent transcriptional regulator
MGHVLAGFSLFAGLDDQVRREIAREVYERTFEAGQEILLAGEPCEAVYLVVRGIVRARRISLEGREYVLDYLTAGHAFNLIPALDGGKTLSTVDALTDTTVYLLACDRFRALVHKHQAVTFAVVERLGDRVRHLSDRVEDLALHTVRTRLARFLLSRAEGGTQPQMYWTQEEIASHIGTVRDVVGRTLRAFSSEGLVRRQRGRLVIADLPALRREAMRE